MVVVLSTVLSFVLSWIVSSIVIYIVTKFFFGEKEGIGTAFLAALAGTIVYTVTNTILGNGLLAGLVGGIVWLIALGSLYKIGWSRAFVIAIIIWFSAYVIGFVLPTLMGPL
jgi:uncharacterized membrane protein YvlD (DUF360 family)